MADTCSDSQSHSNALALHDDAVVCVMHEHRTVPEVLPELIAGGCDAVVINVDIDIEPADTDKASWSRIEGFARSARSWLDAARAAIDAQPSVVLATSAADIRAAKAAGQVAVVLGNEGGKLLEGDLANLEAFYAAGLRELQLAWNVPNHLCTQEPDAGLTAFGRDVVCDMNRLGMVIDVSHLKQAAMDDVLTTTSKPFIHSHGAFGQQLPKAQHKAMADMGGVLGIHFFYSFVQKASGVPVTLDDLLDQIDIAVEGLGINHVGLGADYFSTTGRWSGFYRMRLGGHAEWAIPDLSHLPSVTAGLSARGYSDDDIKKVLGGNFLRLLDDVL